VLGSELVTNGDMESGNPPSTWTVGSSTTFAASVDAYAGAAAGLFTAGGEIGGSATRWLSKSNIFTLGQWAQISVYAKRSSGAGNLQIGLGYVVALSTPVTAAYAQYIATIRRASASVNYGHVVFGGVTVGDQFLLDNASAKLLSLTSLFSALNYGITHATTKANITVAAGTQAGVVTNLDSASSPANFVIATHDGTNARLTKCVGGTYTDLISTAATYVANAAIEIRRTAASDTYKLYYNGAQVGTDQTISDAGIVSNTLHGYFNTYAGNGLSAFSCVAS
jgi:hypothetical protein